MTRNFYFCVILLFLSLFCISVSAQTDPFAYVITAVKKGDGKWAALRKINTQTGAFSDILWSLDDTSQYGITALAYDHRGNRLFYSITNNDQLHYIDLFTMQSYAVADQYFNKAGNYQSVNAGPINRMVIASDDFGYTVTNDGTHLLRFNTQGTPVIRDMGDLVDDPLNKENSIHSICANSGGDLIADNAGNLILITGNNRIYKIKTATKFCSFKGTVSGLPQKFTTSGLAVSENENEIIATSATYAGSSYSINPQTWEAKEINIIPGIFESSDLANSNILNWKSKSDSSMFIKNPENRNGIRVFPNPVMNNVVSVQFNQLPIGQYTIRLEDLLGSKISEQKVMLINESQTETLHVPLTAAQAFYYVRILDFRNRQVSIQKLVVEKW